MQEVAGVPEEVNNLGAKSANEPSLAPQKNSRSAQSYGEAIPREGQHGPQRGCPLSAYAHLGYIPIASLMRLPRPRDSPLSLLVTTCVTSLWTHRILKLEKKY